MDAPIIRSNPPVEPSPGLRQTAFVVAGVSAGLALALSYGALTAYAAWLGDRPIYGVSYFGVSLSEPSISERSQRIAEAQAALLDRSVRASVGSTTVIVPVRSFAPVFDTDRVLVQSKAVGRETDPLERVRSILTSLWSGIALDPALALTTVPPELSQAIDHVRRPAVDASFGWTPTGLAVRPHQVGEEPRSVTLLTDAVLAVVTGEPLIVPLEPQLPMITTEMLAPLLPRAEAMVSSPLTIRAGSRTVSYSSSDLVVWLVPTVGLDGSVELTIDQSRLATDLERVEALVNRPASPRQRSSRDGSVLNPGKTGTVVDREATVALIAAALNARVQGRPDEPLTAATRSLEPAEQTVEPDTTSGLYEGKYLEIDLSGQQIYQYEGEILVGHYRVSTGKWSTPTPIGTFAINAKIPRAYSRPYDLYMPYWMAFLGSSYGLHELPEWPDGRKEGEGHLGTPVSHGCIRLGVGDAQSIYDWAEVGTPVVVHK
jgi:lipoprotein-anchoring transpeptidase ErfK/SrfK